MRALVVALVHYLLFSRRGPCPLPTFLAIENRHMLTQTCGSGRPPVARESNPQRSLLL
jgi:hypothetical protein